MEEPLINELSSLNSIGHSERMLSFSFHFLHGIRVVLKDTLVALLHIMLWVLGRQNVHRSAFIFDTLT